MLSDTLWRSFLRNLNGRHSRSRRRRRAGEIRQAWVAEPLETRTLLSSVSPSVDLNGPDQSGIDYATTFTEDNGAVAIQDVDLTVEATTDGPVLAGPEFRVNSTTFGGQELAGTQGGKAIATDGSGNFVVVWSSSHSQDGSGWGVYAQQFDAAGNQVGGEFQVNTFSTGDQKHASVAMDAAGNFVVTWTSYNQVGSTSYGDVYAQRYNADGTAAGGEFRVNTYTADYQHEPAVAADASGNFVITWASRYQDGTESGVFAQRYNADGTPAGGEFQVDSGHWAYQVRPSVAADPSGNFVITWGSYGQDGNQTGVYARRYNADGTAAGGEFQVNTHHFNQQDFPSVAADAAGNFVITWISAYQDGDLGGVYAQRYNADGTRAGSEFQVNTHTADSQLSPSVAVDGSGNFVITWQSRNQDGSGYGVYAQRYNADGSPAGDEFQVNTYISSDQSRPSVAADGSGNFVITWQSFGQDGSGDGVYARQFTLSSASGQIDGATVTISNLLDGASELLSVDTTGTGITATYAGGVLTLTGTDTPEAYAQVLRTTTYRNTSQTPSLTPRSIEFVVHSGTVNSDVAVTTVSIVAVNDAPQVAAVQPTVIVPEGTLAENSGSFSDVDSSTVSLSASVGTIIDNGNGTWSWSRDTTDGPDDSQPVTVTATDSDGAATETTFDLTVNNVAPSVVADSAAIVVDEGQTAANTGTYADPGVDGITLTASTGTITDNGDGTWSWSWNTAGEPDGLQTVTVTATDSDGETNSATFELTVNNVAPTVVADSTAIVVDEGAVATNAGTYTDPDGNGLTFSASVGTITDNGDGTWNWSWNTAGEPDDSQTVEITATDSGGAMASTTFDLTVNNVAPTIGDAAFDVVENLPNGTPVGTVTGTDPGDDALTYSITGGTGQAAFAIDPVTGEITVADSSQLDFETTPVFSLEVTVADDEGATDTSQVTINLLNQASLTGAVFVDIDEDGLYDANEIGIDGVTVELLDQNGVVVETAVTSDGGLYLFEDLDPGTYQIRQVQPTGVTDGAEQLGTLGGTIVANDLMQVTLARTDGSDYNFVEIDQSVGSGDTAPIGFWQNRHGQALIEQGGTALAGWLTDNFGNVFGDEFAGADGADVAAFYKNELFKQKAQKSAGPAKVDAQFMAVALATYFTSSNLAGNVAADYGFHVTDTGIGTKIVNVGSAGAAFDMADDSEATILQLLLATNSLTDQPDLQSGFAYTYDQNGDGVIDSWEATLRSMANEIFTLINEQGDI